MGPSEICDLLPFSGLTIAIIAERIVETEPEEATKTNIPKPTCTDINAWKLEVEILSDCVFWDTDYEDAQMYIDSSPEKSKELLDWMDIDDDHQTALNRLESAFI